jgi:hypothetical protein
VEVVYFSETSEAIMEAVSSPEKLGLITEECSPETSGLMIEIVCSSEPAGLMMEAICSSETSGLIIEAVSSSEKSATQPIYRRCNHPKAASTLVTIHLKV